MFRMAPGSENARICMSSHFTEKTNVVSALGWKAVLGFDGCTLTPLSCRDRTSGGNGERHPGVLGPCLPP